jgi:uncharacterized protein (DUF488 family)
VRIFTIEFTKKSAERFFSLLKQNNVKRIVDIRLRAGGQLAGFTRQGDLPYFLSFLADCHYVYMKELAPTAEILSRYRSDRNWNAYAERFERLMNEHKIPENLEQRIFEDACLLCSESTPNKCHRRLVAERLARRGQGLEIVHLL